MIREMGDAGDDATELDAVDVARFAQHQDAPPLDTGYPVATREALKEYDRGCSTSSK